MRLGILLALGASVSWAVANVAVQRAGRALGGLRALLWAQFLGGAVLVPFALALDVRAPVGPGFLAWAVAAGLSALLAYVGLFVGFERGRLSVTVPIMSSWSLLAAALAVALGEKLAAQQIAGGAAVVAGVVLVARGAVGGAGGDAAAAPGERGAVLASLGAAVGFGVLIPAFARIAPAAGRLGAVPLVYALELAIGVPLALAARVDLAPPPRALWPIVALTGLSETIGFVCIGLAARHAPVAVVSPVSSLSSAMTVLFAWLALHERPGALAGVGALCASAGVIILSM